MSSQLIAVKRDRVPTHDAHDVKVKLDSILQEVTSSVAPVWPLKDYVAVNPYFGLVDRSFMSARTFLRVFSDCETLMPLEYYASQWRSGHIDALDVQQALAETAWPSTLSKVSVDEIFDALRNSEPSEQPWSTSPENDQRAVRSVVDHASVASDINWHEIVTDEISKFCAAHYDDGQASWTSAWKPDSLYAAWHTIAQIDRNGEVLGLTNMRKLVASLPRDPKAAISDLLCRLNVPYPLWSTVLLCQVFSSPGWFAWVKYQDEQQGGQCNAQAFVGLLAIRLAYDYAVGQALDLQVDWDEHMRNGYASFQGEDAEHLKNAWIRYTLLRAAELGYRRQLLSGLPAQLPTKSVEVTSQMVFCIDVRSERMRRHIESLNPSIETFGFAGFFGLPIEHLALGEVHATAQLPVLLKPQHRIHECLTCSSHVDENEVQVVLKRRADVRWWRKLWQNFKGSSISSFGFVESSGLFAGFKLLQQSLGIGPVAKHQLDGLKTKDQSLRPSVSSDLPGALSISEQVELATRVLSNLGLTKNFARLVVFCGHHSQTNNNPLAAGLDCGACGGHSGAPNARWLALVLNQTDVRLGLCQRGIVIPAETYFVAAVHNTTTDEIEFFDTDELPTSHRNDFEALTTACRDASAAVAAERVPQLSASRATDIVRRAKDWSEVRPEWGLAGNVAFIVGPRSLTRPLDLNGQVFLHSYEEANDPSGSVLETIMTAPMIVANWINMQYYASTVDNQHFGSGSKTIHNVVGKFGILSGNSGDLKTGLPLQSLHDGAHYRHVPMRLLVVICASRTSIERVYQKHELVANLVNNQWLSIVSVEGNEHHQLCPNGSWERLER